MSNAVDIDWGLAKAPPNIAGEFANAFQAGRRLAAPPASANALTGDARSADAIAALSPDQRAAAARRAELLGAVGRGLIGRPYEERRPLLAHLAGPLAAQGLGPRAVANFDPTDDNLAAAISQADALRSQLAGPAGQGFTGD
ncbi:MAG TPA: hypothetical protein VG166_09220 [Caulobacteraceae bacterium]|jgi:hypothetical protein|nr:hypothetical protein [Caulobacteraceae bacterium]